MQRKNGETNLISPKLSPTRIHNSPRIHHQKPTRPSETFLSLTWVTVSDRALWRDRGMRIILVLVVPAPCGQLNWPPSREVIHSTIERKIGGREGGRRT